MPAMFRTIATAVLSVLIAVLAACGDGSGGSGSVALSGSLFAAPRAALTCDDSIKTGFTPNANTTVIAVKAFRKGDPLILTGTSTATTPTASNDVCMVKLNVGPGNPGPADAPSTSSGIGIEVWLPAKEAWNERIHAMGSGGFLGGVQGSATQVGRVDIGILASTEGSVTSTSDSGHIGSTGAFGMLPDGTINRTLFVDFATRAIHEQAVKTKALAKAYYGRSPKYSYWEGGSGGGRQALMLAQNFPEDFDGIIANFPAISWTRLLAGAMYAQVMVQRDLGGAFTMEQQDLISNAAIAACDMVGGQHLGYILDPSTCNYDPTTDPNVLCTSDGGTNTTAACVTKKQALAMNKVWYGMTADGSAPSPAVDNGWQAAFSPVLPGSGYQRWFGLARGSSTYARAYLGVTNGWASTSGPPTTASDMLALVIQNPAYAEPWFVNATGNGQSLWKTLSYAQLSNIYDRGLAMQPLFGNINTDNPDLLAFKARGGKMLTWHGLADEVIPAQGTVNYYHRVVDKMGAIASVQKFYRLYLVPGLGHNNPNGTSNPNAAPPAFASGQFYNLLIDWVEKDVAPGDVVLKSTSGGVTKTRPICVYPKKITYVGGNVNEATSYTCS